MLRKKKQMPTKQDPLGHEVLEIKELPVLLGDDGTHHRQQLFERLIIIIMIIGNNSSSALL